MELMTTVEAFNPMLVHPAASLEELEWSGPVAMVLNEGMDRMRLDLVAMTTLLRSLSFALLMRSVESVLEEEDAGPSPPAMSPEDWKPYV